jgi:hypothetical protein
MFILRKGNSTRDSNIHRQNSNDQLSPHIYGLDRQSSINSLADSDSCYTRDNSLSTHHPAHSSNGFSHPSDPYAHPTAFQTPRQPQPANKV